MCRIFQWSTSHQRMVPSFLPVTNLLLSLLQAIANTLPDCPVKFLMICPLSASHTNNSPPPLPPPPLAKCFPSGLQATHNTPLWCCCHRLRSAPSEALHRQMLPSYPPLTRRLPSGLQATLRILVECVDPT